MAKLMVALVVVALLGLIFTPDVGAFNGSSRYRRRRRSGSLFYKDVMTTLPKSNIRPNHCKAGNDNQD